MFLDFSPPFLYCSHFFSSQALSERRYPSLCPKPRLRPYSCFCLLAAAILEPFQSSCRPCSLSGRGSEPCWDQQQQSQLESAPIQTPQHCCGSRHGPAGGEQQPSYCPWWKHASPRKSSALLLTPHYCPQILSDRNCVSIQLIRLWRLFYTCYILYSFLDKSFYVTALYCH